ncbi:hypothetical protein [Emticicia sp. TH156]|uniref:hypothetical protein n=1 Tax=Emticicia sp. TH156 TaxID=2067454 RepID=UPI000C7736A7|nr:hypothetical protein [Emticicia sp. TH156]PLK44258.1 hypothetical protein C0V77_10700 [Emticicia sp. TH156]
MTDTPEFIAAKQFEIIKAKSVRERFEIFDGMMSFVRQLAIKRIKKRLGNDISNAELKYELIKEYYSHELSEVQLAEIKKGLINYHKELSKAQH